MEQQGLDPNTCDFDAGTLQRLSDLVSRAHARTSATGVAIAVVERDELVTCAAFGASAPEVGTRAPIKSSFSGRCAETGEMQICEDVTNDSRVNGEACAAMGVFSIVMVPISDNGTTRGVLAAFSDRPNSFSPSQLTVLNTFAEITNELLHHRDQSANGEVPTPVASVTDPSAKCETVMHDVLTAYESDRRARQAEAKSGPKPITDAPKTSGPTVVTPAPIAPAPVVPIMTPAASSRPVATPEAKPEKFGPQIVRPAASRSAAATKMAIAPQVAITPEPAKPQSKPQDDSELLSFAADPMPMKKHAASDNQKAERSSPMQESTFLANYEAQQANSSSGAVKFVLAAAGVIVLAGAVFGYTHMSRRTSTVAATAPMTEAPLTQTAQSTPTTPVQPTEMPAVVKESSQKDTPKQIKVSDDSQHNAETKSHEEKAESKQADPVFIRKGSAPAKKADAPEVQAPVLMANLGHQSMPQMSATVVPPKADFPTATVTAPKLLNGPRPTFPAGATALHLTSDTVVLNAKVMANGKVGDISVVRGHPVFVQAVKDAVKRWQYTPAQLDNKPTDATIEIVFKFGQGS